MVIEGQYCQYKKKKKFPTGNPNFGSRILNNHKDGSSEP